MIIDSHAHVEGSKFASDRDDALRRAFEGGVDFILTVGQVDRSWTSMETSLAIAESDARIATSIGMHPHDAKHYDASVGERMLETARHPKIVAWGECGLDFYYDNSPRDQQEAAFRGQLRHARTAGLPVIIHSRDAAADTLRLIEDELGRGSNAGVFHCFSYDAETAAAAVALGFYVSFSGIVTFPTATPVREAAQAVPLDCILVETDSPFLAPIPHRGKRNEPAHVVRVAEEVAALRGISLEEIGTATTENFVRLFPRARVGAAGQNA